MTFGSKFKNVRLILASALSHYEGEPVPPVVPPVPEIATNPATGKAWTKAEFTAEVNRQQSEEKKKWQTKNAETIKQLETLQSRASTSEEDKAQLQTQIEQLRAESQTKEEQQKTELSRLQEKYNKDTEAAKRQGDSWKARFEDTLFSNDVANACMIHEAFDADQIDAILRPRKKTVEDLGADGKPTGNYVSKVSFPSKDKEGKSVILELPVGEAIKLMKEMPEKYGNLFKATAKAGFGSGNEFGIGNSGKIDITTMSDEQYEKHRASILKNAKPASA